MKKILSIISAIMIGTASVGFLLIQQLFESRIKKIEDENETIITQQRDASDFLQKATSSRLEYALFRDGLDVYKILGKDKDKLSEKEKSIRFTCANAATNALNGAIAIKKVDQDTAKSEMEKITKITDYDILKEYYKKYFDIAANGTTELDKIRKQNVININDLSFWKDLLWYVCLFIQNTGFILAIIALAMETDN